MATQDAPRMVMARNAVGALLFSGAMLLVGPMGVATAEPAATDTAGPGPAVSPRTSEMGDMGSRQLQNAMDRTDKTRNLLSNILKQRASNSSAIFGNLK